MRLSIVLSCAVAMLLCACSKPEPPEKERPPEPQAESRQPRATELRDAIQAPIEKARSVEQTTLDAAEKQRAEIDAQTGS